MTEQADLFTGARRVFWGYFFLLLDFNLNLGSAVTIPLLANCRGVGVPVAGGGRARPRPALSGAAEALLHRAGGVRPHPVCPKPGWVCFPAG